MLLLNAPDEFIGAKFPAEIMGVEKESQNSLDAIFLEYNDSCIVLLEQPEDKSLHGFWVIRDLFFIWPFKQVPSAKFDDSWKIVFFSESDQNELSATRFQVFLAVQM